MALALDLVQGYLMSPSILPGWEELDPVEYDLGVAPSRALEGLVPASGVRHGAPKCCRPPGGLSNEPNIFGSCPLVNVT